MGREFTLITIFAGVVLVLVVIFAVIGHSQGQLNVGNGQGDWSMATSDGSNAAEYGGHADPVGDILTGSKEKGGEYLRNTYFARHHSLHLLHNSGRSVSGSHHSEAYARSDEHHGKVNVTIGYSGRSGYSSTSPRTTGGKSGSRHHRPSVVF